MFTAAAPRWVLPLWLALASTLLLGSASSAQPTVVAGAALIVLAAMVTLHTISGLHATVPSRPPLARELRELARRTGVSRQVDPDAPGRSRPRAPASHSLV